MRVLFSLVALAAGTQALSSSLYQKRAGWDVCSYLDCPVSLPNPHGGPPMNFGNLDICACLSGIPALVKSNPILIKAASVVGDSKVTAFLTGEVKKKGMTCNYPDHATPVCSKDKPCGFSCSDGYTASNGKCVCKAPFTECNGTCGYSDNCPSKSPKKRDTDEWKRGVLCEEGYTACGVLGYSRFTRDAYECVDSRSNLESCGGCSIPLHRGSPLGADCTSLPGVADVSCMRGSCHVHKCMPGYQLSIDNSMCMDEDTVNKFMTIAKFGWEQFVPVGLD